MRDSFFVNGVAFKKTFSYAGFEQQPKKFLNPKILLLNIELELKSEKENAEIRLECPTFLICLMYCIVAPLVSEISYLGCFNIIGCRIHCSISQL